MTMFSHDPFEFTTPILWISPPEYLYNIWKENPQLIGLMELWKQIPLSMSIKDRLPRYLISNYGRVFDTYTGVFIEPYTTKNNYKYISVFGHMRLIHRIVMVTFNPIPGCDELQVNHKDENKSHNWIWNLEWVTCSENRRYSINTGLIKVYGEENPTAKNTDDQVREVLELLISTTMTYQQISEKTGVSISNISNIVNAGTRANIAELYGFRKGHRGPRSVLDVESMHKICKYFECTRDREFKKGDKGPYFVETAVACGLDPNKQILELIKNLYNKRGFKDIVNQYIY